MEGVDLSKALGKEMTIRGGIVNPRTVVSESTRIIEYVGARTRLFGRTGGTCAAGPPEITASYQSVIYIINWDCSQVADEIIYATDLFFEQSPNAGQFALTGKQPNRTRILLSAGNNELSITGPPPGFIETASRFTVSGIEHIFIGIDHIAFLLALLLWARRIRSLIKIVTAFTIAHSITLSLAVLDLVTLPAMVIEAAIAASIIYVAAENFFRENVDSKWRVTFFLGLVHGFGFAGALRNFGIPSESVATALAAFNIGVEIGQIAIVGIGFPLLILSDSLLAGQGVSLNGTHPRNRRLVRILSGAIILAGVYWLIERTIMA